MKHDKRVKKQNIPKGFHLYIEGPGRVDDSKSIDLSEAVTPDMMIDGQPAYTIGNSIPSHIKFSKEYSNIVYDVIADFSAEGKETVLNQFKRSILTPKMFCGDCGSKLYYHAGRNVRDGSEYFRCSQYKTNRSLCTTNHYVRDCVMRDLVTETVRKVAECVTKFEPVFLYLYAKKNSEATARNMRATRSRVEKAKKRIAELNKLIMKVYENHVLGSLSEVRYNMMAESYEKEQKALSEQLEADEATLSKAEQSTSDLRTFLKAIRQFTEVEEIDENTINTLISRIEVFERVKVDGKLHLPVKIHFTAVGIIDVPTEKEILRVMEEIRNNSKATKSA